MADRIIIHSLEKVVSKESAIKLREMGFNQFCDCYYHTDNDDPYDYEMGNNQLNNDNFEDYHERCSAPYVNQALLWLMHTYGIALERSGQSQLVITPANRVMIRQTAK